MPCSSYKAKRSKMRHRTEKIWFRRLRNAFTLTEDIMKRKHYLKRYLRRKVGKRLKNDDEEMVDSMSWMASTYQDQGRWTEAEKLEMQVIRSDGDKEESPRA